MKNFPLLTLSMVVRLGINIFSMIGLVFISGFYSDFKVGLRSTVGNHGMDFIAKIPFVEAKNTIQGVDAKVKQNYQILLGYNFSF